MQSSVSCAVRGCPVEAAYSLVQKPSNETYALCAEHKEKFKGDWSLLKKWTFQGNCTVKKCLDTRWCLPSCDLQGCKHSCAFHE